MLPMAQSQPVLVNGQRSNHGCRGRRRQRRRLHHEHVLGREGLRRRGDCTRRRCGGQGGAGDGQGGGDLQRLPRQAVADPAKHPGAAGVVQRMLANILETALAFRPKLRGRGGRQGRVGRRLRGSLRGGGRGGRACLEHMEASSPRAREGANGRGARRLVQVGADEVVRREGAAELVVIDYEIPVAIELKESPLCQLVGLEDASRVLNPTRDACTHHAVLISARCEDIGRLATVHLVFDLVDRQEAPARCRLYHENLQDHHAHEDDKRPYQRHERPQEDLVEVVQLLPVGHLGESGQLSPAGSSRGLQHAPGGKRPVRA
mmetsp:Transcript_117721/g.375210  ORF Transcript_117721/g.375210 Transcript_117721/m.375210 type:complete len:319 (+) Transcript_117721:670-1626(+)